MRKIGKTTVRVLAAATFLFVFWSFAERSLQAPLHRINIEAAAYAKL